MNIFPEMVEIHHDEQSSTSLKLLREPAPACAGVRGYFKP